MNANRCRKVHAKLRGRLVTGAFEARNYFGNCSTVGNVRRLSDDNVEKYIFLHHGRCHKLPQILEWTYQDNFITSNALELAFVILLTWEQQTKTYQ